MSRDSYIPQQINVFRLIFLFFLGGVCKKIEYYTRTRWRQFVLRHVVSKRYRYVLETIHLKINQMTLYKKAKYNYFDLD